MQLDTHFSWFLKPVMLTSTPQGTYPNISGGTDRNVSLSDGALSFFRLSGTDEPYVTIFFRGELPRNHCGPFAVRLSKCVIEKVRNKCEISFFLIIWDVL